MRKPLLLGLAALTLIAGTAIRALVPVSASGQAAAPPAPAQAAPSVKAPPQAMWALEPGSTAYRLLLGVGDARSLPWNGRVRLDRGETVGVEGWRFRVGDETQGDAAWTAHSLPIRKNATKKAARKAIAVKKENNGPGNTGAQFTSTGVVVRVKAPEDATLTLETDQGEARVALAELSSGAPKALLGGRIEAQRVPTYAPLAVGPEQEDFPAAVSDGKQGAWVAYVEHVKRGSEVSEAVTEQPKSFRGFVPEGGGDQIKLLHFDGRVVDRTVEVTPGGRDVWRPAVAVDGEGNVVVVWSEMVEANWDLYMRRFQPGAGTWGNVIRLTRQPGTDTHAVLAADPSGGIWMAWQTWIEGQADIRLLALSNIKATEDVAATVPVAITDTPANEWSPALAIGPAGVYVAYDTYETGSYDVRLTVYGTNPAGGTFRTVPVAASSRFEARPSITLDRKGRAWVAYEERDDNWGKDFGNLPEDPGAGLYRSSLVRVRCVEGETVLDGGNPVAGLASADERRMNGFARLALDATGRPWLLYRHRQEAVWGNNAVMVVGAVWVEYATALVGGTWTVPQPLPRSDNLLDNRPALVATPGGAVLAFYSSDGRLHREIEHAPDLTRRYYSHSGTPPGVVNNDLFVAALLAPNAGVEPTPAGPAADSANVPATHPNEAADVARVRAHRVQTGGKSYQLLRGEFHRHTELSQDGGNDGALEDMWRYALDVARLDWIGNGDHDNGGGKEYTWWLVQKTTDLYHNPPTFVPMFTYERSVTYPGGHRNVMFARRGVRTLPRLVDENGVRTNNRQGRDEDAAMLYAYLRELDGICAVHTSGTGMGTDFRQNDPVVEPFVEIYQGTRNSYEHLGAPRVARGPTEALGGWRPLGMVWNALALQYRLGFQSSSDHVSTHISFAVALAEEPTREAIHAAFKRRHCYAATDNILLDVRAGEHLMGDEFRAEGPVTLKVFAHGTGPIARVDIIKDFRYAYTTEPKSEQVSFTWTDDERPTLPVSWYYVRVLQENGELAWGSPVWVRRE